MKEFIFSGTKNVPENTFICQHLQAYQLIRNGMIGKIKTLGNPVQT